MQEMRRRHIKFPSINQYRNTVKVAKLHATYVGKDEDGAPIYDPSKVLPTLEFLGTVKLHGTNASIVHRVGQPLDCQSRKRILTVRGDNAGFAQFTLGDTGEPIWNPYFTALRETNGISPSETVIVYGEWCGKGIQKGVAIAAFDKTFIIFAIRVYDEVEEQGRWLYPEEMSAVPLPEHDRVKSILDFPTYRVTIDFNNPVLAQNELARLTENVEAECPVAAAMGVSGTGEGIVWRCVSPDYNSSDYWFKVKGEKHSVTKVKTLAPVDVELMTSIHEFVGAVLQSSRLQQGIEHLRESGLEPSKRTTAEYLRWVVKDVIKEESDTMEASGLQPKQVNKHLSTQARKWYFEWLSQNL
jgi:hypothetical protein